jgi:thiamine biosynthesis lipoprotein
VTHEAALRVFGLARSEPPRRVLVPLGLSRESPALGGVAHAFSGLTMGTTWSVRLIGSARLRRSAVQRAVQAELDAVVAQMSTWDRASDLCRFNRAAPGTRQVVPEAFFEVLARGIEVARSSGGAFDPTAGALVDAWGFGATPRPAGEAFAPPTAVTLDAARRLGGWQRLRLDAEHRSVCQPGGLALDLSAIAKGHAVDRVAQCLAGLGFANHLVEVGGELRGSGSKADGSPWWVALESPESASAMAAPATPESALAKAAPATLIALHDLSIATSGDYRRWFEHGGQRYSHTLDPRDGWPIRHRLASVTVVHADCMSADALSTAINVLGPEPGLDFAERHGLAARLLVRVGEGFMERMSTAFEAMLQ